MKKALLGPFQMGGLEAAAKALKMAEEIVGKPGADMASVFYATAFQAGVDHFLITYNAGEMYMGSGFLEDRISTADPRITEKNWELVRSAFSKFLPDGWGRDEDFRSVWKVRSFVTDLFDAMESGSALLAPLGIPDTAEVEECLPTELAVPISNLLKSIEELGAPSPVPLRVVTRDAFERYNEILVSDLFAEYANEQASLEDSNRPPSEALPGVIRTGRALFAKNRSLLSIRKAATGFLQITPRFVDIVFGALPGALSETAAKLGMGFLESRRRVVIHDFEPLVKEVLLTNFVRMFGIRKRD